MNIKKGKQLMPDGHFKADALSHFHIGLMLQNRAVGQGGSGGPTRFLQIEVNAISTRGVEAGHAHHITTCPPPDFQTFLRP